MDWKKYETNLKSNLIYNCMHWCLILQISYLKDSLSAIQIQTLRHKRVLLEEKLELQQKHLREGGKAAFSGNHNLMSSIVCIKKCEQLTL